MADNGATATTPACRPVTPIGFPQNPGLPPLTFLPVAGFVIDSILPYETPIQFRIAEIVDLAVWNAISGFQPAALDVFGRDVRYCVDGIPAGEIDRLTGYTATLAFTYSASLLIDAFPIDDVSATYEALGLGGLWNETIAPDFDSSQCSGTCAVSVAVLARCATDEMVSYFENDGWNSNGGLTSTFNRNPYEDFGFTDKSGERYTPYSPQVNSEAKRAWTPLLESDSIGFFFEQQHVVPFIGFTGKNVLTKDRDRCQYYKDNQAPKPKYDYPEELQTLFETTRITAENNTEGDRRLAAVEIFDSKFTSILPAWIDYAVANGFDNWGFWSTQTLLSTALYDGVILVWREKVIFDAIRPTTLAQTIGRGTAFTYAGPYGSNFGGPFVDGPEVIKQTEFEPVIRTMPHSEYPSASACVCQAFFDALADKLGSDSITPPATLGIQAGGTRNSPGLRPVEDVNLIFNLWSEMNTLCGQSRLFGGMHFTKAVPAGANLCKNIGKSASTAFAQLESGALTEGLLDLDETHIRVCEEKPRPTKKPKRNKFKKFKKKIKKIWHKILHWQ
uniref:Vanadium-dependent haloperoxidase NapH1-like second helical-bundle domain-containing protein n=1 Tax=Lotharella globosa TaxID=91324 RepID=A0A7S3Z7G8_9EUKA